MKIQRLALTLMLAWLAACGGDAGEDRGSSKRSGPFLEKGQLAPGKRLANVDGSGIESALESMGALRNDGSSEAGMGLVPEMGDEACLKSEVEKLKIKAKGSRAEVAGEVDVGHCLRESASASAEPGADVVDAKGKVRIYLLVECEGVDLSPLDGLPALQLAGEDRELCRDARDAKVLANMDSSYSTRLKTSLQGKEILLDHGGRTLEATVGENGGPCHRLRRAGGFFIDGCQNVRRELVTLSRTTVDGKTVVDAEEGSESYLRLDWESVEGEFGAPWYSSGRIKVVHDGWKGEVFYKGKDVSPVWIMTSGDETRTGELTVD